MLDDLDFNGGQVLGHYIKRWADRHAVTGEVKGATVNLQHDIFIVTSNHSIAEVYGPDFKDNGPARESKLAMQAAIQDRF